MELSLEIKKAILTLEPEDVMELERILIDRDKEASLNFLREKIKAKIDAAQKSGMHWHDICHQNRRNK